MTTHEHAQHSNKQYFTTWCLLLAMTLIALGVGYIHGLPYVIKAGTLVTITLAKIFLIGSVFMHLKTERKNLVIITFSPLILSMVMFFFTFGEVPKDPTHARENVKPGWVLPTGHHEGGEAAEGKAEEHSEHK
jgi:caa(3)-type oxidase subunit IV